MYTYVIYIVVLPMFVGSIRAAALVSLYYKAPFSLFSLTIIITNTSYSIRLSQTVRSFASGCLH